MGGCFVVVAGLVVCYCFPLPSRLFVRTGFAFQLFRGGNQARARVHGRTSVKSRNDTIRLVWSVSRPSTARLQGKSAAGPVPVPGQWGMGAMGRGLGQCLCSSWCGCRCCVKVHGTVPGEVETSRFFESSVKVRRTHESPGPIRLRVRRSRTRVFGKRILTSGSCFGSDSGAGMSPPILSSRSALGLLFPVRPLCQ
ncbi:hypothetical protein GQ607_005092 [Colletotrichum asianum]|uniref:Uncharacterized protein n=1 Tax=Colletotrichum asianum TaxID=702518 RepID=A0A8H3ZQ20_9PEZI|nr:hypothetical protein GQ607_005092 [Colletotrichum asianum]